MGYGGTYREHLKGQFVLLMLLRGLCNVTTYLLKQGEVILSN